MIVKLLMNLLKGIILFVISLFPTLPDLSFLSAPLDSLFKVVSYADVFVDLKLVSACLVALLVFSQAELIWGVIMWVVRKIPGVS